MAGAGSKLFVSGDVLTAAQVNTYLMDQTVMRFADEAARTAAFGGAGEAVLAEGMVTYLMDTNTLEVYDGSAFIGVGGGADILQVQVFS
jgi:nitrogen fixation protein FixH